MFAVNFITYRHKADVENKVRFRALASEPLPVWAVDPQPDDEEEYLYEEDA